MTNAENLIASGAIALLVSAAVTPIIIRVARRWMIMDVPGGYKAHRRATPLLGGLGIALGITAGTVWSLAIGVEEWSTISALGTGVLLIVAAGLLDDIRGLSARHKLAWQVGAASLAAVVLTGFGVRLRLFLGWDPLPIAVLTTVWIVVVTNAVNFLDNMDGLCAGSGTIAGAFLAAYNFQTGELQVAFACAAVAGACAGFLPYNWPNARVFLGDTGSMLIGFALAALSVMGVYTPGAQVPVLAILAPLFVLAVPLLDAVLVVLIRLHEGHPPWLGDRRHISHRLVRRGMRPATAVAALWAASAACGFAALLLPAVGAADAVLLIGLLVCALGALAAAAGARGLP